MADSARCQCELKCQLVCAMQAMASEGEEQAEQRGDKLKGLSMRLEAAANDPDEQEDRIRSHPAMQVCPSQPRNSTAVKQWQTMATFKLYG